MTRAATTLAGPCTGAPRRDFLLGLRHGQLVGAHVPSWCSGHGVDAGCSRRAGPPGQLTSRSDQTPAEGTGWTPPTALVCQSGGVEHHSREASMGQVSTIGLDLCQFALKISPSVALKVSPSGP